MSKTRELNDLEAEITLSLPDKPTSAEILGAIHRAVHGGFALGVTAGSNHTAKVVTELMFGKERVQP